MSEDPASAFAKIGAVPFMRSAEDVDARWDIDILWLMLVTAQDTAGRWSLMDQLCRQGSGPPPHRHIWSDEMLYVVEGEVTFLIADEIRTTGAGAVVYVPRNTRHGFRVDSPTARILNGYTPASWEGAIAVLSAPVAARTLPPVGFKPPPGPKPDDVMAEFGMVPEGGGPLLPAS